MKNNLTIEEARGKICPFKIKEGSLRYWQAMCEADECMAWQWELTGGGDARGYCGIARRIKS